MVRYLAVIFIRKHASLRDRRLDRPVIGPGLVTHRSRVGFSFDIGTWTRYAHAMNKPGMLYKLHTGNALAVLPSLDAGSVQCCVTSPPYWGLRDYGDPGQAWPAVDFSLSLGGIDVPVSVPAQTVPLGLEATPIAYVAHLVAIFRQVRRVIDDDGTLWLNVGDTYSQHGSGPGQSGISKHAENCSGMRVSTHTAGLKQKDLVGIPWLLAYALRSDGWYLRSDIIWHKRNPMPESVTDRPTKGHEYVFLLAKSALYWCDMSALMERWADGRMGASGARSLAYSQGSNRRDTLCGTRKGLGVEPARPGRNVRTVWSISSQPYKHPGDQQHYAVMPPELARRCVVAGAPVGGTVLDPFAGACTVGVVSLENERRFVGVELMPSHVKIGQERLDHVRVQRGDVAKDDAKPGEQIGLFAENTEGPEGP